MKWSEATALGMKRCCATGKRQCRRVALNGSSFCEKHQYVGEMIAAISAYGGNGHGEDDEDDGDDEGNL